MSGMAISARGIRRRFKSGFVLDVPEFDVAAGEHVALLGPSGSGKTSLLEVLGLLERPDEGIVSFDGSPVTTRDRAMRMRLAAVFQRPYLFKGTVDANVAYGLMCRGIRGAERDRRVAEALERVGLNGYATRSALTLSGGEAQRVSLARALAVNPDVLVVDEPLASLDPLLKRQLTQEFARILDAADVTVLWVTHDQDEALVVAERLVVMRDGRIVTDGRADDVVGLPKDDWTAAFLGVEVPQRGVVGNVSEGVAAIAAGERATVYAVSDEAPGTHVLFAVRPEDVVLFEREVSIPATTARNRMRAIVVSCEARGATNRVILDADGVRLAASVSRAGTRELGIAPGQRVTALFKASAVRVRRAEDDTDRSDAPAGVSTMGEGRTS